MENLAATERKDSTDRISRLPEPVLHHILCFLSKKKAVQTSVLSKSWRHLGSTRPVMDLRGNCDFNQNNETLLSVVDNTFQRYHDLNLSVKELHLELLRVDSQSNAILEKWIPLLINTADKPALTKFRLSGEYFVFEDGKRTRLELPSAVFKAESLEDLYLINCTISSIENVALKNLRNLRLNHVYIEDETLEKVMSGCPFLEYALLYSCKGLKTVSIANANRHLKDFRFFAFYVPTLQTWKLDRDNFFPRLKSLDLHSVQLSTESFENFSDNFPLLEEFTLFRCGGFEEINLFSHSLKHLTMQLNISISVYINAPNLLLFMLDRGVFPTTISFDATSREWKSKITLDKSVFTPGDAMLRFLKLNEMVRAVSQSQISLDIYEFMLYNSTQIECGTIHDPVVVEHLNITSNDLRLDFNPIPRLFYALFQICRPRYVISPKGTQIECIRKILMHEREDKEYYWQQHLEEVSIEAFDSGESVWHRVQGTCLPDCASNNRKIRFGLKWRH